MGCKAAEMAHNINNTFGPGTNNKNTMQWVQEIFQRQREPWGWRAQWLAIGNWWWLTESILEADPLTQEDAEELSIDYSILMQHLKQIGKVKKFYKWVPYELIKHQKNFHFEVLSSIILCNNYESFLNQIVMCNDKWVL